jgi:hypothetical protein
MSHAGDSDHQLVLGEHLVFGLVSMSEVYRELASAKEWNDSLPARLAPGELPPDRPKGGRWAKSGPGKGGVA